MWFTVAMATENCILGTAKKLDFTYLNHQTIISAPMLPVNSALHIYTEIWKTKSTGGCHFVQLSAL